MKKAFLILFLLLLTSVVGAFTYVEDPVILVKNETTTTSMVMVNQQPDPVSPGSYVEIRWKVENQGAEATKDNIIFEIEPEYPFTLEQGNKVQELGKLDSYQVGEDAYIIYYKLKVDEEAVQGPNKITLKYSTNNGNTWLEKDYYIRVQEQNYLIDIDSVSTTPENIKPGNDFTLTLGLHNLAGSEIRDVTITPVVEQVDETSASIQRTELPFSPLDSTNEKVYQIIRGNEKKTASFDLTVDADAENKVHKVPIIITYTDDLGNNKEKNTMIGVKVFEKPEYLVNLENTEIYKKSQKGEVVLSISNIGPSKINFLTAELLSTPDYKIISPSQIYLGNLESDDYETADYTVYVDTDKEEINLPLKLSYRDEFNNKYEETTNIDLQLYNSQEAVRFGFENAQNTSSFLVPIIIGSILLVFWLFMLIDAIKTPRETYKKALWLLLLVLTFAIGGILYYLIGRKKRNIGGE